jgi:flagellar motor switch protein FliN/FliY
MDTDATAARSAADRPAEPTVASRAEAMPPLDARASALLQIPVQVTAEVGRTRIPIRHLLQLAQGSVIELETPATEPMDLLVNGRQVARGEVIVVNEHFGIRVTKIVPPDERPARR